MKTLKFTRVSVGIESKNVPGLKLLQEVGMRYEGEFIKDWYVKGAWVNTLWYALLVEEFQEQKTKPV